MKEVVFIRQNIEKWRSMEQVAARGRRSSADELADAYLDVTSDLAFAQSHYPESRITLYLNNLASALHNEIYGNKHERWSRLLTYWTREVPQTIWEARRTVGISLAVFVAAMLVGIVSQLNDAGFERIILGDDYVDMTLENIANGEPMAVYDGDGEVESFLAITLNNVYVSFTVFAAGIFTSLLAGWLLFGNGVMLGSFMAFFYQHGLLCEALPAVWLHGTLEIWAIIVAGAAGITMGNGWLMPGTYGRTVAFRRSAKRGLKIVVGTVPVFIVAGFIEGFFTRHVEWPLALRLSVIVASLAFIGGYYIYLPYKTHHGTKREKDPALSGA